MDTRKIGKIFGRCGSMYLENMARRYRPKLQGFEFLNELTNRACLMIVRPDGNDSRLNQSLFILLRTVKEETRRQLLVVVECDEREWSKNRFVKLFQRMGQSFSEKIMKEAGFILVNMNSGASMFLLNAIKMAIEKRKILIFHEGGNWDADFNSNPKIESAAYTAIRFNLPIVPARVRGHPQGKRQSIEVVIGQSFKAGQTRRDTISIIRNRVAAL
jgi:hypothetical protein